MITLFEAIGEFALDAEANGISARTIKWYRAMMKDFIGRYGGRRLDEFNHAIMRDHVLSVRRAAKSVVTARDRIVALHRFWAWAEIRYSSKNPMAGIQRPRLPEPRPKAISAENLLALYKACPQTRLGARDRAIIIFLADTGTRAAGIINLRREDVDMQKRRAIIRGEKGGKARAVPFSHWTADLLRRWMLISESQWLFCTQDGGKLSYTGLREIIRRIASKAGVKERHNLHSFRHFAAREFLSNGGGIVHLSKLLGHSNITTTAGSYAIYDEHEIADEHSAHSPLKSLFRPRDKV